MSKSENRSYAQAAKSGVIPLCMIQTSRSIIEGAINFGLFLIILVVVAATSALETLEQMYINRHKIRKEGPHR